MKSELTTLEAGKRSATPTSASPRPTPTLRPAGALGQSVLGRPRRNAGLRSGDVVTRIGSATINGTNDLVAAIAAHAPGDQVEVTVRRGSQHADRHVTLGTQPAQAAQSGQTP